MISNIFHKKQKEQQEKMRLLWEGQHGKVYPKRFLPGRENIVLSKSLTQDDIPDKVQDNITVLSRHREIRLRFKKRF